MVKLAHINTKRSISSLYTVLIVLVLLHMVMLLPVVCGYLQISFICKTRINQFERQKKNKTSGWCVGEQTVHIVPRIIYRNWTDRR